MFKLKLFFDML